MLIDRPQITETSTIVNATVPSGAADPADPDIGELFYRTDLGQLRVYGSSGWQEAGSSSLSDHTSNYALHLNSAQNTLLDGISANISSTEINQLDGISTSETIQTQINRKFNTDGTIAATGNFNLNSNKLTNVGTPTANGDATNMLYVEQEISRSVPVGSRGQVPFIQTDNTRASVQGFTALTGQFIESDAELALAQTRITSNATIFNEWYRFSHGTTVGGTLTRTGGVSRLQFTSTALTVYQNSFPVGSQITVASATNTSFNGTFTITSTTTSGSNHVVLFSQSGQPDVGTAVTGSVTLNQPALTGETQSWVYNSGTDTISATVNSETYIGFISDRKYSSYVLEARLSSTNADDDTLGVVIAWAVVGGVEYTLSAVRSTGGNGNGWQVIYNYGQSGSQVIYNGNSFIKWGNGAYGATPTAAGYVQTPSTGWSAFPTGTKVRVTRNGDIFTVETSDLGTETYVGGGAVGTIDLTSNPVLAKFRGPSQYGFAALSQAAASFATLSFTDNQNAIYDVRNGNKYEYVGGSWVVQPSEPLMTDIGPGKFLFDTYTQKLYYTDSILGAIKLVTNVGESLAPEVATLQSDFSTHINSDARHLTTAQNDLLDNLTASATELNYVDGVTSSIQDQLNARLRLDGSDTMAGNLQMGNRRITGLLTDANSQPTDAVTKAYVDTYVQGLTWKTAAKVATTANIALTGLQTINGVALVANDRVLVKNQTTAAENGIYLVSPSAWSRAPDANEPAELDGAAVFVLGGTVDSDTAWIQTNAIATVGSSAVSWSRFAASGGLVEGAGINIASSTVSVDAGNGLNFSGSNALQVNASSNFIFNSGILDLSTMSSYTPQQYGSASAIPVITVDSKGRITNISTAAAPTYQASSADLNSIAAFGAGTTGGLFRTADGTITLRSIAASGSGVTVLHPNGILGNPTIQINDTPDNINGRIVSRDGTGNFAANTITASLIGAASANVLKIGDLMSGNLRFSANNIGINWELLPNFYLRGDIGSGNPGINFDINDYIDFNSASNTMTFSVGVPRLQISATSITTPGGFTLSNSTPAALNSWFSTPAYATSQGDNRTHFGYNTGSSVGNYIRGAFTTIDSPVTMVANATIVNTAPVLVLQDTDSTGAAQVGYVSFRDSAFTEQAWIGYGSATSSDLAMNNNQGDINLRFSSNTTFNFTSAGNLNIFGSAGNIVFADSGTTFRGIRGTSGANDQWYIGGGATASDGGYLEISTGDNGTEPIYVRQYSGVNTPNSGSALRTLTLLDASGNTSVPGSVTVSGDVAANGGDITTTQTTFNLLNTTAATVNAFGAATALNLGADTGITTVRNPQLRVGSADGPNFIAFYGTAGDSQTPYTHSYIGERIYPSSNVESSELLIFKGNDVNTTSGPDRVRVLAAEFTVHTHSGLSGAFESVGASASTNRLTITNTGEWSLNGSVGSLGQVLTSGGPGVAPTWTTVSAGGGGSVTGVSVTANNGITQSVTNPSSNVNITLGLGDITPSSVQVGTGGIGNIRLIAGNGGNSGLIEFYSPSNVRQGYIGGSATNAGTDAGTLPYRAGIHEFNNEISVPRIRITSTGDASASSTTHGLQIGPTNSSNIIIDDNEIMARTNGAVSTLNLNADGGIVFAGSGGLQTSGNVVGNEIVARGTASEGGHIVLGYGGGAATAIVSQTNSCWNIDVLSDQTFRIFRANGAGAGLQALTFAESTGDAVFTGTITTPRLIQTSASSENIVVSQILATDGDNTVRKVSASKLSEVLSPAFGNIVNRPLVSDWTALGQTLVAGLMGWKHYGNNHVIFDASNGTAPNGAAINNSVPANTWTATYPTLMGWNGTSTYGVKVNRADYADSAGSVAWANVSGKPSTFVSFANSVPSPGPQSSEFSQLSINGFDAYSSTDFPGNFWTGIQVNGPGLVRSAQLAMNWNSEEGQPSGIAFRVNDDTGTTSAWSQWTVILNEVNFNTYAPKLDGTGAHSTNGAWNISISGSAGQVNAINETGDANARPLLWGQSTGVGNAHLVKFSTTSGTTPGISYTPNTGTLTLSGTPGFLRLVPANSSVAATITSSTDNGVDFICNSVNSVGITSAGIVNNINGSLTTPTIRWSTDSGIGIYRHSATTLGVKGNLHVELNVTAFSDARLKKDVEVIPNALQKVDALRGVTYTRIDGGHRGTGVIAQEVEAVLPEAVASDGEHLSVAYGNMVGLLIQAIKELKAEVDDLKQQLGKN